MPRLCPFRGSHPRQAQQGLQEDIVCRPRSWEVDVHVQEFPALLCGSVNASRAEASTYR